jgi:aminomethyltransferase
MTELKRTPLYDEQRALGAKLVPFAGYELPIQYPTGILAEHHAVRSRAGLFDVSHMGEIEIRGPQALEFVQLVTTNDAARLEPWQAQYSTLLNDDAGILDDCLVYRFPDHYLLVVNASNHDAVRDWLEDHAARFAANVIDLSAETALLALQGPAASRILGGMTEIALDDMKYYHFANGSVAGVQAVISRTGYTGEDGFELYLPAEQAVTVWRALLEAGEDEGLVPVGLGARDSLRLEMGYLLHGNDIDPQRSPLEAGLGWVTRLDKGEFIGRDTLIRQKEAGLRERLIGVELTERGLPRRGYEIRRDGDTVGTITSGGHSPMLGRGIGLAYVRTEVARPGIEVDVVIRERSVPGVLIRPPFYEHGSVRSK